MGIMPEMTEDADAPIIVPLPGQILRRTVRTKIRKPGQTTEGSHRFKATRRGLGAIPAAVGPETQPRTSSDMSASDHGDAEPATRRRVVSSSSVSSEPPRLVRPDSFSAETFIYDAYARDDPSDDEPPSKPAITVDPLLPFESPARQSFSALPVMEEPEPVPIAPVVAIL